MSPKPYPKYKDSGIPWLGDVPVHWSVRRLRDTVVGCINGIWGSEPDGCHDLPCVRVADFDRYRHRVRLAKPTMRSVSNTERLRRTLMSGDLLLEKSGGGDLQPVGVVVLYDYAIPAVCSNFIARMPVAAGYDPHFLTYLHFHLYSIRLNVRSIKQTTGIQNLDSSAYLSESVPLPPLSEQAAIVRYLDYMDRRTRKFIHAKQKLIKLLEEQKQAIIHHAVTRGLDPNVPLKPSGVEWLGDVPEHWEVRKLKFIMNFFGGGTPSKAESTYWNGSIPWVSPKDMKTEVIYDSEDHITEIAVTESSTKIVPIGSILIVVRSGILQRTIPIALCGREVALNQDMKALCPKYCISAPYFIFFVRGCENVLLSEWTKQGATVESIEHEFFANSLIPIPPKAEQLAITKQLDKTTATINAAIDRARCEISLLREYRTRLIADVVTGKLDVREAAAHLPEESDDSDFPDDIPGDSQDDSPLDSDTIPEEAEV